MDLNTWLAFALLETFLCLTPGPAVLFVVGTTLGRSRMAGVFAAGGIIAGNTIYFVLSATSLGAILLASYETFTLVKWVGAAYLVYVGVVYLGGRALFSQSEALAVRPLMAGRSFGGGTITQLSNPKALIFFSALLPQFIDPHHSLLVQVAILGVTSQVIEGLVLAAYVLLAHGVRRARFSRVFERVAGVFLIGAALKLALTRRT
jgi:homoserine/homoserine lactone efflux protein